MDFITVLKAYLNNETISQDKIDEKIIEESIEQSLQTILYHVFRLKGYRKYYFSWVILQEQYYIIQNEMTSLFNQNKIKHLYFKGAILSKIYDDPNIRTRGDIDIYIDKLDFDKVEQILLENLYEKDLATTDSLHHIGFKKNDILIEIHFMMFEPDEPKKWRNLFKNPFEISKNIDGYLYELDNTYHFLYCILHFAHHLRAGAGIRYILDFYYLFKNTKVDLDKLHNEVSKLGLKTLYSNIINSIRFLINIDYDNSVECNNVDFFIEYMLNSGIHGFNSSNAIQSAIHNNKIKFFFKRVFLLNDQYRKSMYPKLGVHWYLYPICLFKHFIYLIRNKTEGLFKLFSRNKNKEIYKKLGI